MSSHTRKRQRASEPRIDNFKGPPAKYIKFLEERDHNSRNREQRLQQQVRQLQQQLGQLQQQPNDHVSSTLIICIESPEIQQQKPPVIPKTNPELLKFLAKLPKTNDHWSARRKLTRLDTTAELLEAFCKLTRISSQPRSLAIGERPADTASILEVLQDYDSFTIALVGEKIYATQISNYSALIFACIAIVALKAGADQEAVFKRLKAYLIAQQGHSNADSMLLGHLLEGARWVVSQMNELYSRGLRHRSCQLFLLWGCSLHTYRKFTTDAAAFIKGVVICKSPENESHAHVPFDPAFIVKTTLGDRCPLTLINEALGTSLSQEVFDTWTEAVHGMTASFASLNISCLQPAQRTQSVSNEQGHISPSISSESDLGRAANHPLAADSTSLGPGLGELGGTPIDRLDGSLDSFGHTCSTEWLHLNSPNELDFESMFDNSSTNFDM